MVADTQTRRAPLAAQVAVSVKVKTLLVDDNAAFLATTGRFLTLQAFDIIGEAHTGPDAIRLAEAREPDLVLLDLEMSGLDGLDALRTIKALPNPPRVIIVTLHDQDEYRTAAQELGADGFVTKREITTALMPLVRRLFGHPHTPAAPGCASA